MPIRKRLTDAPKRTDPFHNKKGRHPLLKIGSPHFSVWDTLCTAGKGNKGLSNAQIQNRTTLWHPQVMKDLLDARLVAKVGKNGNEFLYTADPKGRGIIPTELVVDVVIVEDERGYFFATAKIRGSQGSPKGGTREIGKRSVNFIVPLEGELGDPEFKVVHYDDTVIEGEYNNVITNPAQIIIQQ